ncbi:MAG: hypothetical protein V3U92_18135 [Cellulophaga sp.]|jgi:hypothetical protein
MDSLLDKYKEEFNNFLDEEGDIVIGSFSMPPSIILESMDEESYKEQLLEFVEGKKVAFKETIYTDFPAPIAYFFERTKNSSENENHQLQLLRSTWESIIFILYATVLGEIHNQNFDLTHIRLFRNKRISNDHNGTLSDRLGWKMEFIQKALEYDRDNSNNLKCSDFIESRHIETLKELNHERNSFSHIAALNPVQAKERYDLLLPKVYDLLFDLSFLENISIIKYKQNNGALTNIRFNRFDGHSLREVNYDKEFSTAELTSLSHIFNSENMLMEFDNDIFCVSPFIHFIKEGNSQKLVICYYKKINQNTGLWIYEPIAGAETEVEIDSSTINYNINNLLSV